MVRNDNREDVQIWLSVFRGRWAILPMVAALIFLPISFFCNSIGMDLVSMLVIGSMPFICAAAFVLIFINGHYPSYPSDLVKWWMFQLKEELFMSGLLDKEPRLWVEKRSPKK